MNKELFKRYSTWANGIAILTGAVLTSLTSLGLSAATVGYIMLAANVIIAGCQFIKQEAK